jgi:hypothetical protein
MTPTPSSCHLAKAAQQQQLRRMGLRSPKQSKLRQVEQKKARRVELAQVRPATTISSMMQAAILSVVADWGTPQ